MTSLPDSANDDQAVESATPVWHAPTPERLRFEILDTLSLAYDRASGQTHLLASPLPELLELLAAGPATTAALVVAAAPILAGRPPAGAAAAAPPPVAAASGPAEMGAGGPGLRPPPIWSRAWPMRST